MAWKSADQSAKERFKNLVVDVLKDIKDFYNNMHYNNYFNAVNFLDSCLESYKEDPKFKEMAKILLDTYKESEEHLRNMEVLNQDADSQQYKTKIRFYEHWVRLLIDLANRTVFSGKMMNVDIDLDEVFKVWNAIRDIPIDQKAMEKKISEDSKVEQGEIDPDDIQMNIVET